MDEMERAKQAVRAVMAKREMAKTISPLQPNKPTPPSLPKADVFAVPPPTKGEKHSKKLDLAKLPKNWRNQIFAALKPEKQSRLASSVALLWATGCRPVEIEKGVKVQMIGDQLVIEIQGAKVGEITNDEGTFDRGLEWRKLTINPKLNKATEYLSALCIDGKSHLVNYNKNSLRTRLNEVGRLTLKKLKDTPSISPYSFRHAMGSDVKSCDDLSDEQRSMIMGHLSCDSLSVYGRRRHRGGVSPVAKVEASAIPHGEYTDSPKKKETKKAKPR